MQTDRELCVNDWLDTVTVSDVDTMIDRLDQKVATMHSDLANFAATRQQLVEARAMARAAGLAPDAAAVAGATLDRIPAALWPWADTRGRAWTPENDEDRPKLVKLYRQRDGEYTQLVEQGFLVPEPDVG